MENMQYTVGSLVSVKEKKYLLIGFDLFSRGDKYKFGYTAVPFPQGYSKPTDIYVLLDDNEFEIVERGFSDGSENAVKMVQSIMCRMSERFRAEEINNYVKTIQGEE